MLFLGRASNIFLERPLCYFYNEMKCILGNLLFPARATVSLFFISLLDIMSPYKFG